MIEHPIYARVCKTPQQFLKMQEDLLHSDLGLPKYVMHLPVILTIARWKPKRTEQQVLGQFQGPEPKAVSRGSTRGSK